jgi:hypothetical protein
MTRDEAVKIPRPCDDADLERRLIVEVKTARASNAKYIGDILDDTSVRNIVLQITEGSAILDDLIAKHVAALTAPAAGEDVEAVAQAIFESSSFYGDDKDKRPWFPQGNSIRQQDARRLAHVALSRLRAVPQGWKLVPEKPTGAMLKAMTYAGTDGVQTMGESRRMRPAYMAVLDAAPYPPAAPAPEKEQPK